MKLRLFALLLLPAAAMAQTDPEMPSNLFFDTDLVLVIPKWTMQYGVRGLAGASSTFRGAGYVDSVTQDALLGIRGPGDFASKGIARGYHDGTVSIDTRTAVVDDGTGKLVSPWLSSEAFTEATQSVWQISPESAQRVGHHLTQPQGRARRRVHLVLVMRLDDFNIELGTQAFRGNLRELERHVHADREIRRHDDGDAL